MTVIFPLPQEQDTLQKLNDSLNELANRKKISPLAYNSDEDDAIKSLYPLAFEVQTATSEYPQKKPTRHSSFSGPRYAKISQKPKRAHSFAQESDFKRERISITHLDVAPLPELPRPKFTKPPRRHYAKPNKPIFRSNSMQITKLEKENSYGPKLSSKYGSCSYDELDSLSILEVGSLNSSKNSERSLVDALTDIPSRSINSILSSSFEKETNDVLEYKLKINKNNYTYSFASPALTAIENMDRTSQTYSSSSTRRVYSETHYAIPNNVRRDIDEDENIETSYKRKYTTNKISPLPAVHQFIPRINPEKPLFVDRKFESVGDSDQTSNEEVNSEDKSVPERCIEDSVDQSYSQPYSSSGWRKDGKITHFESNPLPVIEEIEKCSSDDNESENQNEYEVIKEDEKSIVEMKNTLIQNSVETTKIVTKPPIAKPPRYSVLKKNMLQNLERSLNNQSSNMSKAEIKLSVYDATEIRNSKDVSSRAGSEDQEIYHISFSSYELTEDSSSHYDTESANTLNESQESIETIDKVSSPEMKRNKIVLRVPSFKSTSCQTERYKPIRRRASSFVPSNQNSGRTRDGILMNNGYSRSFKSISNWNRSTNSLETSSSSGYSSPEITSKNSSSNQSGPPSPGDKQYSTNKSNGSNTKSNVTIIEINRTDNTTLISTLPYPPPIPPKPKRYRHSTAGDLRNEMVFISSYDMAEERSNVLSSKYDGYILRDNEFPLGVHQKKKFDIPNRSQSLKTARQNTPRIVDIKLKNGVVSNKELNSTTDFFAEDGRMSVLPRFEVSGVAEQSLDMMNANEIMNVRDNVKGRLDEVLDINIGLKWRREREKELTEKCALDKDGSATAAYLASLELLASHYRHQALTNAKKLQRQMEILEDQNILPKNKKLPNLGEKKRSDERLKEEDEESVANWRTTMDDLRKVQVDKNGVWHT